MTPIQEIHIYLDENILVSGHLVYDNDLFKAEVIVFDPSDMSSAKAYSSVGEFDAKEGAFKRIIGFAGTYAANHNRTIMGINNPCNTEFVAREEQLSVIQEMGLNAVPVKVNGYE